MKASLWSIGVVIGALFAIAFDCGRRGAVGGHGGSILSRSRLSRRARPPAPLFMRRPRKQMSTG